MSSVASAIISFSGLMFGMSSKTLSLSLSIAQGLEQQSLAARSHRDKAFLTAYRHLPDARLPRGTQRLADDGVALGRELVGWNKIIGPFEIARIDVTIVRELRKVDRVLGLELDLVE